MRYLLFFVILLAACESPVQSFDSALLPGSWLGGGFRLDKGVYKPFNHFMDIDSQLNVTLFSATWRDSIKPIEIKQDSIFFPFRKYLQSSVKINQEELTLGGNYPFLYKKVNANIIEKDTSEIKNELTGNHWVYRNQVLDFKDETLIIYDKKKRTMEHFCWDIYNFNGIKFLQKKGNFLGCESPYDPLSLIHRIGNDTLEIEMWVKESFQKLTYKKVNFDSTNYSTPNFQLCNPYLYENFRSDWYYFKYPSFDGGLYRLKKIFDERYKVVKHRENNGLVKLKFIINCAGQVGNIELQTMDFDYKEHRLNPKITRQILEIFKTAGNWNPAEHREDRVDAYKFIVFRIKEGEIDEIFP